eukprot:m.225186 g.225186  ORF g.225186 m.225186 type:complete len:1405 (-) comp13859_c2_seq8:3644-7858(-)
MVLLLLSKRYGVLLLLLVPLWLLLVWDESALVAFANDVECSPGEVFNSVSSSCEVCTDGKYTLDHIQCYDCDIGFTSIDHTNCIQVFSDCGKEAVLSFEGETSPFHVHDVDHPSLSSYVLDSFLNVIVDRIGNESQILPAGITYVDFVAQIPGLPTCSRQVRVLHGVVNFVNNVSKTMVGRYREYIASEGQFSGGSSLQPVDIHGFHSTTTIAFLPGFENTFVIDGTDMVDDELPLQTAGFLCYCESLELSLKAYSPSSNIPNTHVNTTLEVPGVDLLGVSVDTYVTDSCFCIRFQANITAELGFPTGLFLNVHFTESAVDGLLSPGVFFPVTESSFWVEYDVKPERESPLYRITGVLTPELRNCPSSFTISAQSPKVDIFVGWESPTPMFIPLGVEVVSNYLPYLLHRYTSFPLKVRYFTTDGAANCSFTVDLDYKWDTSFYASALPLSTIFKESYQNDFHSTFRLGSSGQLLRSFDIATSNRFLTTVFGDKGQWFRLLPAPHSDVYCQLTFSLEMLLERMNDGLSMDLTGLSLKLRLINLQLDATRTPITPSEWSFSDASVVSGSILKLKASANLSPVHDPIIFQAISFELYVPQYRFVNFTADEAMHRSEEGFVDESLFTSDTQFIHTGVGFVGFKRIGGGLEFEYFTPDTTSPTVECKESVEAILHTSQGFVQVLPSDFRPISSTDNGINLTSFSVLNLNNTYTNAGEYNITVTVEDERGNTAMCFTTLVVTESSSSGLNLSSSIIALIGVVGISALFVAAIFAFQKLVSRERPYNFNERLKELSAHFKDKDGLVHPREINRSNLDLLEIIGSGHWGDVTKAVLEEHKSSGVPGFLVAVKTLHSEDNVESQTELMREAAFMAQLQCDYIVKLHGVCTFGGPMMMIMEYCEHGSLQVFLRVDDMEYSMKVQILSDACAGLKYLEEIGIVHRDIASRNVLLSSSWRGRIADFGMAREISASSEYYTSTHGGAVPVRWSSPEALEEAKFSNKSDVWSFGVVCYECFTYGDLPYSGLSNQKVWVSVMEGHRLSKPHNCPRDVYKLMRKCWKHSPNDRPTFEELFEDMKKIVAKAGEVSRYPIHIPNRNFTSSDSSSPSQGYSSSQANSSPFLAPPKSAPPPPSIRSSATYVDITKAKVIKRIGNYEPVSSAPASRRDTLLQQQAITTTRSMSPRSRTNIRPRSISPTIHEDQKEADVDDVKVDEDIEGNIEVEGVIVSELVGGNSGTILDLEESSRESSRHSSSIEASYVVPAHGKSTEKESISPPTNSALESALGKLDFGPGAGETVVDKDTSDNDEIIVNVHGNSMDNEENITNSGANDGDNDDNDGHQAIPHLQVQDEHQTNSIEQKKATGVVSDLVVTTRPSFDVVDFSVKATRLDDGVRQRKSPAPRTRHTSSTTVFTI